MRKQLLLPIFHLLLLLAACQRSVLASMDAQRRDEIEEYLFLQGGISPVTLGQYMGARRVSWPILTNMMSSASGSDRLHLLYELLERIKEYLRTSNEAEHQERRVTWGSLIEGYSVHRTRIEGQRRGRALQRQEGGLLHETSANKLQEAWDRLLEQARKKM